MGQVRDFLLPDLGEGLESGEVAEQLEAAPEPAPAESEVGPAEAEDAAARDVTEGEFGSARRVAGEEEERQSVLVGYGAATGASTRRWRGGRKLKQPTGPDEGRGGNGEVARPLAKPPVRKLAKDLGVDLAAIAPGSGEGRVATRDDVHRAAEGVAAPAREVPLSFRGREPGEVIAVQGIRKRIVSKMVESRTKIPEASTEVTVDATRTWQLAAELTEQAADEGNEVRITAFTLVARATVLALRRLPTLNATLNEDANEIRLLEPINLGIAVDADRGLLVAVVKDPQRRSTLDLTREVNRVVRAARDGSIAPATSLAGPSP